MDKDRIEGSAKQTKRTLQRLLGRFFGDRKMQLDGAAEEKMGHGVHWTAVTVPARRSS